MTKAKSKIPLLMILPPLVFLALTAMFVLGMNRDNPDELPTALAGQPVPPLGLVPLGDKPFLTDETLQQPGVKLVNYWASWCAPCRAEHAQLTDMANSGIPIFGVNYKDDPDKALGFLAELGDPYAAIGADQGRTALNWGVYGVPETYIIDGNGKIVMRFAGPITPSILESTILPAIEGAK